MIGKCNTWKIARIFFDYPSRGFLLREISKESGFGLPSVRNHIRILEKIGVVEKREGKIYPLYFATRNELYKTYKLADILIRMRTSGLVDFIIGSFAPDAVILFGSASRGEDVENSDVDLFVVAGEKEVDLRRFESALNRKIELHFTESPGKVPKELMNSVVNGITLYGFLEAL